MQELTTLIMSLLVLILGILLAVWNLLIFVVLDVLSPNLPLVGLSGRRVVGSPDRRAIGLVVY